MHQLKKQFSNIFLLRGFITTNLYDKGIQRTQISSAAPPKRDKLSKILCIFKQASAMLHKKKAKELVHSGVHNWIDVRTRKFGKARYEE